MFVLAKRESPSLSTAAASSSCLARVLQFVWRAMDLIQGAKLAKKGLLVLEGNFFWPRWWWDRRSTSAGGLLLDWLSCTVKPFLRESLSHGSGHWVMSMLSSRNELKRYPKRYPPPENVLCGEGDRAVGSKPFTAPGGAKALSPKWGSLARSLPCCHCASLSLPWRWDA